ncbi:RagB/SusD family nutrient uptake outer membrane protein [Mucilaginibacter sp. PAMB04274]|uniref:RagB/SusD family nutrient uptake outer membrane protein n=1 Tax=Mucilaginibacter sp. PAMB04274 TaxID=3138568 RepID=UPI0031F68295
MKIKNILCILLFTALTAGSCKQDILNLKPLDGYSETDVFADAALLNQFVNGIYRGMGHPFGGEGDKFIEGMTDDGYNQHGGTTNPYRMFTAGEIGSTQGEALNDNLWANSYDQIRRTNLFFDKTLNSPVPAAQLQRLTGEIRFLRAFFYARLMIWYGGVPLITETYNLGQESYDVSRNTPDEIAAFVVRECDLAAAVLPSFTATDYGKASREAALALKARTLLYAASPLFNPNNEQARWIAARDANKVVIDLTTINNITNADDYGNVFNGKSRNDVILSRSFTQNNAHGGGEWGINMWFYPGSMNGWGTLVPTQDLVNAYEMTNGKLPSDPTSGFNINNPYTNRDPRFAKTILYQGATIFDPEQKLNRELQYFYDKNDPTNTAKNGIDGKGGPNQPWNNSPTAYNFRKFLDEGKRAQQKGADENLSPWIYFRKSEFYLNYAEAQIALNNEGEARSALNTIRSRYGMPAITEGGAALVQRYRNERRVELVIEQHRFHDMRRWKLGAAVFAKPALGALILKNGNTFEYNLTNVVDNTRKFVEKMNLVPIPFSEIQRSHGKLVQNPGY